jgi:hypothetical protein
MEQFGIFLLQMACWLAGFWLVYALVLRKETFFKLNRWFLVAGLALSVIMPFVPLKYKVIAPSVNLGELSEVFVVQQVAADPTAGSAINLWLVAYLLGVLYFILRFVMQVFKLYRERLHGEKVLSGNETVFLLNIDITPFSFFNKIYVSKNLKGETELKAVVAHEKVHINECHWADLLLLEVVRALQWFNPLLVFYRKAMLQNHEYLADYGTLKNGVSARTYQAILVNQMLGMPVISIAKRFHTL